MDRARRRPPRDRRCRAGQRRGWRSSRGRRTPPGSRPDLPVSGWAARPPAMPRRTAAARRGLPPRSPRPRCARRDRHRDRAQDTDSPRAGNGGRHLRFADRHLRRPHGHRPGPRSHQWTTALPGRGGACRRRGEGRDRQRGGAARQPPPARKPWGADPRPRAHGPAREDDRAYRRRTTSGTGQEDACRISSACGRGARHGRPSPHFSPSQPNTVNNGAGQR